MATMGLVAMIRGDGGLRPPGAPCSEDEDDGG